MEEVSKTLTVQPLNLEGIQKEEVKAVELLTLSKELVIESQDQYEYGADILKKIKGKGKDLEAERKKITIPLDNAKRAVQELFRKPAGILKQAEDIVKKHLLTYTDKQEEIRRKQQGKLDRQAKAEEERKKKAMEKKIADAIAKGNEEKAIELEEKKESIVVEAPVIASKTETPAGMHFTEYWIGEVIDKAAVPEAYKVVDMSIVNKTLQAQKGKMPIPGIKIRYEKRIASRSR